MNLMSAIISGYNEFKANKKKSVSVILIALSAILVLIAVSYNSAIHNYWNNTVKSFVDFRTYFVTYDNEKYTQEQAINKLKKYQYVSGAASSSSYLISMIANDYVNNNMDGTIYLEGTSDDGMQVILGNQFSDYSGNENMIVCAKQFYPKIELNMSDYNEKNAIDISNKVGKSISLSFLGEPSIHESFKLVGIYDARKNYTEGNVCYASFSTVDKLNQKYQSEVFNDETSEYPLIMVIDSVDHSNNVLQEIKKDGFYFTNAMMRINTKNGNEISVITTSAAIAIIILTLIINFIIILRNIENKKSYYAIMCACGYTDKQVGMIQFFEQLIIGFIAFILSIPFAIITISLIKQFYFSTKIMYLNMVFSITPLSILVSFSVCFVIPVIFSLIATHKMKKINIIEVIKGI